MKKSKKNSNTSTKHDHPGRPKYTPVYPRSKEWTFTDWMDVNGIETNPDSAKFGKGPNCTMLTLRKAMERDMYFHKPGKRVIAANRTKANPRSVIVNVRGVTAEPNSESGLGRRANLYALRSKGVTSAKPAKTSAPVARKTRTPKAPADLSAGTKTYEDIKAILAAPAPVETAPALTVPAVTITPAPAPEVAPAPVVEVPAPAPVAVETANAETATPVAS